MSSNTISDAFAVVYAEDGSQHKVCWTAEEALAAIDELAAAGIKPVMFVRSKANTPGVVNNAPAGFTGVQAGVIHGGVQF